MPRNPTRPLLLLALLAFTLLTPTRAIAFPQGTALRSAAEHAEPAPLGLFARLWDLLSAVWTTGSILEPNGAGASTGTEPNSASTGDTGSGLEPDGRL